MGLAPSPRRDWRTRNRIRNSRLGAKPTMRKLCSIRHNLFCLAALHAGISQGILGTRGARCEVWEKLVRLVWNLLSRILRPVSTAYNGAGPRAPRCRRGRARFGSSAPLFSPRQGRPLPPPPSPTKGECLLKEILPYRKELTGIGSLHCQTA